MTTVDILLQDISKISELEMLELLEGISNELSKTKTLHLIDKVFFADDRPTIDDLEAENESLTDENIQQGYEIDHLTLKIAKLELDIEVLTKKP